MIESWFPTLIMREDLSNVFDKNYNEMCYRKILEIKNNKPNNHDWICDTYSTCHNSDLVKDDDFKSLIDYTKMCVSEFAKSFGASTSAECVDFWGNIAEPGQYQEKHVHPHCHFSCSYYVKCQDNSGDIVFFSPFSNDLFKLYSSQDNSNPNSFTYVTYAPIESHLIIFRSNTLHMVKPNKSRENRCSIAMNFICRE